ncbi:hypothetical protein ACOMHN_029008 [Nucella lapillus]
MNTPSVKVHTRKRDLPQLDLKGNCNGANSGFCKIGGTYCDWLEQCKPRAGRFGGGCEVEGSKCEMAHSVCQDGVCVCTDGYKPGHNFHCGTLKL